MFGREEEGFGGLEDWEEEEWQQLRHLEIVALRRAQDLFAGEYRSAFKGRGLAFRDHRAYQPGDEIRWIDWKVSARMGETYIKQFTEERERTVMLLCDISASMDVGTRSKTKRFLSMELATLLAMSAVQNNDRVGLILFSHKVEKFIQPDKGRKHVMRLLKEMKTAKASTDELSDASGLDAALQLLSHASPRHTIAFVLSDFLYYFNERFLKIVLSKHEVIAFIINDSIEEKLPEGRERFSFEEEEFDEDEVGDLNEERGVDRWGLWFIPMFLFFLNLFLGVFLGGLWFWMGLILAPLPLLYTFLLFSERLPFLLLFRDAEGKDLRVLFLTEKVKRRFEKQTSFHWGNLEERFAGLQISYLRLRTDRNYLMALMNFFRARKRYFHK